MAHSSPVRKTDELNWKSKSNKPANQYSAFDQFTSHSRCNNQHAVCFTTWNVRAAPVRNRKPSVQRKRKKKIHALLTTAKEECELSHSSSGSL
jgi:hypothetical protein